MEALVNGGTVLKGTILRLDSVPLEFLRDLPLVDGGWIDAYVVELGEMGAYLLKRGYSFKDVDDNSPCAWDRIGRVEDGRFIDAESGVLESARKAAQANLAKYVGRRTDIDGRAFISFQDYSAWKGRLVKGKLEEKLSAGILARSWNQWVDKKGVDGARIAGVKVGRMECYRTTATPYIHPEKSSRGSRVGTSYSAISVPIPCMRWTRDTLAAYLHTMLILIERG